LQTKGWPELTLLLDKAWSDLHSNRTSSEANGMGGLPHDKDYGWQVHNIHIHISSVIYYKRILVLVINPLDREWK